jgi:hypothetical protein
MLKYLERILGKPIKYYETLMSSKTENFAVKENDIQKVLNALQPHIITAKTYNIDIEIDDSLEINSHLQIPKNKKKEPLPLIGTFKKDNEILFLFVNQEKVVKDFTNCCLLIEKADNLTNDRNIKLDEPKGVNSDTVPIWEEIIHRFPEIHKLILSLNPQNPWTLYKKAVKNHKIVDKDVVLGGYPQWRINNVDFRKIKKLNYLMEYKIDEKN